jgi:hypothetical protein
VNLIKLTLLNGAQQLFYPVGLRFADDPVHGPIVLVPEVQGVKAYQLGMTIEEVKAAFRAALPGPSQLEEVQLEIAELKQEIIAADHKACQGIIGLHQVFATFTDRLADRDAQSLLLEEDLARLGDSNRDRWCALQIHLGLVDGWEHLHEGAAEVKGCLPSLREELEALADTIGSYRLRLAALTADADESDRKDAELEQRIEKAEENAARWRLEANSEHQNQREADEIRDGEIASLRSRIDQIEKDKPLFCAAERIGALEEADRLLRKRLRRIEEDVQWIESRDDFDLPEKPAAEKKSEWEPLKSCKSPGRYLVKRSDWRWPLPAYLANDGWCLVANLFSLSVNARDPNAQPESYIACPIPE